MSARAMLVCASHSPLMLVDMPRSAPDSQDSRDHDPLKLFTGLPTDISVLPVFVNCAAPPRAPFRRVRQFGAEIGRYLSGLDRPARR